MAYPRSSSSEAHYIGVKLQPAKGTGATPDVFFPYQGSATPEHGMAGDEIREAGTGPYMNRMMKTAHAPNGRFGCAARPKTVAQALAYFAGDDSVATNGDIEDHTITPNTTVRRWLTLEAAAGVSGDIIDRFVDAVFKTFKLSVEGNKDLMYELGWFGLSPAWQATAATPTYEAGQAGSTPGGPYRAADATYTIDGSAAANVQMFEVNLEWTMDEDIYLSDVVRGDTLKLGLTGTVKVKQLIDVAAVAADYRKINYGSTSGTVADPNFFGTGAFIAAFNNGLSAANERTLTLTIPGIDWTKATHNGMNPDGETMYLEREGTITKDAGVEFFTVVAGTADATSYVA